MSLQTQENFYKKPNKTTMWYSALPYKEIFAATFDEMVADFRAQGIPEETIAYLVQQQGADKGMAINYLKGNPSASLQDIQGHIYDSNLNARMRTEQLQRSNAPSMAERQIMDLFPETMQLWPQVQLRKLRLQKTPKGYTYRGFDGGNEEDQGWNLQNTFQEIADWAKHAAREDPYFQLSTFNLQQAIERAKDWHIAMAGQGSNLTYTPYKRNEFGDLEDERVVYTYPDGWHISQVTNKNDLSVEGNRMNHCVGSYCSDVEAGDLRIFSLRNPRNEPVTTIELGGAENIVHQIKAKNNAKPGKEIRKKIGEWFATLEDARFPGVKTDNTEVHWDTYPDTIKWAIYEEAYGRDNDEVDYSTGDRHSDYGIPVEADDESRDIKELDIDNLLWQVETNMNGTRGGLGGWDRLGDNDDGSEITQALGSVIVDHDVQLLKHMAENPDEYKTQKFEHNIYDEQTKTFNFRWVLNKLGVLDIASKYEEKLTEAASNYPELQDGTGHPDAKALANEDNDFLLYYMTLQEITSELPKIAQEYARVTGLPESHLYHMVDAYSSGGYTGVWSQRLMEQLQPRLMKHKHDFTTMDYPTLPNGKPDESVFDEGGWKYSKRRVNWYK